MTKLFTLMAGILLCGAANAQVDSTKTDSTKNSKESDTIRIGGIIIINKGGDDGHSKTHVSIGKKHKKNLSNVSTNWGILDLGFVNYTDKTDYGNTGTYIYNRPGAVPLGKNDFDLNDGKSAHVGIWLFMQRLNLVKHQLNLKYGLGLDLNNYRYKSHANISYLERNPYITNQSTPPTIIRDSILFSKNKLAADYFSVPLMLNFVTNPGYNNKGLSISFGISVGYLYNSRNKQISDERGKLKNKGDYDLEHFKFSYTGEIGLGPVKLYASYSPQSFYNTGLDMRSYSFGIRLSTW